MKRHIATMLALLMYMGLFGFALSVRADEPQGENASAKYNEGSYVAYLEQYPDNGQRADEILIEPKDAASTGVSQWDGRDVIRADAGDTTVWRFSVPQEGYYNLEIEYLAVDGTDGSMERNLYIDDEVPFNEARGLLLKREFRYADEKTYNILGNEIRPERTEVREWTAKTLTSSSGYIIEDLKFYLSEGTHTLSLEAVREPILYGTLRFYQKEPPKSYAEVKAEYELNGYTSEGLTPLRLPAEQPLTVSDFSIYPATDRSSAYNDPPSLEKIVINVIGGDNWKSAGQFIKYGVNIEKSGLYTIGFRYKQDASQGLSIYRKLLIDGELPFEEAANIRFTYDSGWQTKNIGDGQEEYLFYFAEGQTYELTLEVTCGEYAGILSELNECLTSLNAIYRSLLMITGPDPDVYRDYNFKKLIPSVIEQMDEEHNRLQNLKQQITQISESVGTQVTAIDNLIIQLDKMHGKPEKYIASGLKTFQSNISSLGTWIMNATSQPLMLDTIFINGAGEALPEGDTGFFGTVWYEIKRFAVSFFNDYSLASETEADAAESIDVWIYTGRDQAQIVRNLIDNRFVQQENVAVNLKLVTSGTLMPAILAGKGPDVSLGAASSDPINLAVRNAVLDLTEFSDCGEILSRFHDNALVPFTFKDAVYALPETQSFLMMFYRADILEALNVKPPSTWDEMFGIMLELQANNLQVGLPSVAGGVSSTYNGFLMFLVQQGGALYSDDAGTSLLDSDVALSAFKRLTDFYVLYDFPVQYDFANRFRSGEMPIAIQEYTAYNQLVLFAPEIKGLWKMVPIPGTRDENGVINNSSISTVTGTMILKQTEKKESCWKFLKWWTSEDTQSEFGMQLESVLGESAKYATANRAALKRLSWAYDDREALYNQWNRVAGIPEVPGGYYSQRYVEFAFNKVINASANAVETLESNVPIITLELRRKLKEFGY